MLVEIAKIINPEAFFDNNQAQMKFALEKAIDILELIKQDE